MRPTYGQSLSALLNHPKVHRDAIRILPPSELSPARRSSFIVLSLALPSRCPQSASPRWYAAPECSPLHLINVPQSASPASGVPVINMKSFTPFLTKIEKVRGSFALPESVDCIDSAPLISTPSRVMMPA